MELFTEEEVKEAEEVIVQPAYDRTVTTVAGQSCDLAHAYPSPPRVVRRYNMCARSGPFQRVHVLSVAAA